MNDQTITIYNHHKNADKTETWQRTVIKGVSCAYKMEKVVDSSGVIKFTQALSIIIPVTAIATDNRQYIDAVEYSKLTDTTDYWTADAKDNHDIVVGCECVQEVSNEYKISKFKTDYQKSGIVKGVNDNTYASFLKHYKVVVV